MAQIRERDNAIIDVFRGGKVLKVVLRRSRQVTYLGREGFPGGPRRGKTIQINYKMSFTEIHLGLLQQPRWSTL